LINYIVEINFFNHCSDTLPEFWVLFASRGSDEHIDCQLLCACVCCAPLFHQLVAFDLAILALTVAKYFEQEEFIYLEW